MEYMSKRLGELGRHLAEDVDALGLQPGQMGQFRHARARPAPRNGFQ